MFSEIRRSERITEKTEKEKRLDWLYFQLADCLAGNKRSEELLREIDLIKNENGSPKQVIDPDQLFVGIC